MVKRDKRAVFLANEQLRYAISVLGKNPPFKTFERNRVAWVLGVLEDLEKFGWFWQARVLRFHLHRYLKAHPLQAPRGAPDLIPQGDEGVSCYTLEGFP